MKVIEFKPDYRNETVIGAVEPADNAQEGKRHSFGAWVLLAFLRFYIVCLSPVFGGACKYYPSCSNYAVEAVTKHGARRGFVLAAKRLLRCRPFTKGGFDPVPDDIPHAKRTSRANHKLQVVSGTELKIRATERRML